jgi:predicted aspartyl protease
MVSITTQAPYLKENGPTCEVVIKPSDRTIAQLKVEKKDISLAKIRALIDTGAQTTAISQEIVEKLKLVSRGTAKIYTSAKNAEIRQEYDIALEFDHNAYIPVLRVIGANLKDYSIDCLIGRDVLQHGTLIYKGKKNEFTLKF